MHEGFVTVLDAGEECLDGVQDNGFFGERAGGHEVWVCHCKVRGW